MDVEKGYNEQYITRCLSLLVPSSRVGCRDYYLSNKDVQEGEQREGRGNEKQKLTSERQISKPCLTPQKQAFPIRLPRFFPQELLGTRLGPFN